MIGYKILFFFEVMRLIVELASINCFLLLYHAPGRISGISNDTAGFFTNDPGAVRRCVVHKLSTCLKLSQLKFSVTHTPVLMNLIVIT